MVQQADSILTEPALEEEEQQQVQKQQAANSLQDRC